MKTFAIYTPLGKREIEAGNINVALILFQGERPHEAVISIHDTSFDDIPR